MNAPFTPEASPVVGPRNPDFWPDFMERDGCCLNRNELANAYESWFEETVTRTQFDLAVRISHVVPIGQSGNCMGLARAMIEKAQSAGYLDMRDRGKLIAPAWIASTPKPADDPFFRLPSPEAPTATRILTDARDIVTGSRQAQYGPPERNFDRIAQMWSAYRGETFTAKDVCWMMVLLKASRAASGTAVADNAVDACGYAALAGEMEGSA